MLNVADPCPSQYGGSTFEGEYYMKDLQVKEVRSVAQTTTENRQTTPTEALLYIQLFNSCNPYTRESLARIQNRT